jgi:hypothetical protein
VVGGGEERAAVAVHVAGQPLVAEVEAGEEEPAAGVGSAQLAREAAAADAPPEGQTSAASPALSNINSVCVCVCMCVYRYTHTHTHTNTGQDGASPVLAGAKESE